jgi:hypothetical protein
VDQYSIINVVYNNKKKDYAKVQELVDSIRALGLKENQYTPLTFEVCRTKREGGREEGEKETIAKQLYRNSQKNGSHLILSSKQLLKK